MHWPWDTTQDDWADDWRHESVHDQGWRWTLPHRTIECKQNLTTCQRELQLSHGQEVGSHLQEVGHEYGTTTGRRRRCGWLDLVVMKHSCLINGYDCLNLTKLDVLDGLSEIKVGVKYLIDEKELPGFPGSCFWVLFFSGELLIGVTANLDLLSKVDVLYVTLPGWQSSTSNARKFEDLPEVCQRYIGFIEAFLDTPITWIGVGPGRESMIKK